MVVDTSVILAVIFEETHGRWAAGILNAHAAELRMSTVNLAEALILIKSRQPEDYERLEARILGSSIRFIAPDHEQARIAAMARARYPLNLGDCFAYALAVVEESPIVTLDGDFRSVDRPVVMP